MLRVEASSRLLPRACLRLVSITTGRVTAAIRAGRLTRSVTIARDHDSHLYGCDATGIRSEGRRWCDTAAGYLRNGRVTDPRLDILCRDRHGRVVATAWINPARAARTVVVDGDAYRVAGGLPVRVATTHGVDYQRSRATFRVAEYDRFGALIVRHELRARVSG